MQLLPRPCLFRTHHSCWRRHWPHVEKMLTNPLTKCACYLIHPFSRRASFLLLDDQSAPYRVPDRLSIVRKPEFLHQAASCGY